MSCNGCRVLRKGCGDSCIIRPCLQWIEKPEAQGNATVFVAKFFGRASLMSFISAVPIPQRPALFKSLLYEACGRTINPVSGAVGLLCTDNWHLCQAAVETVLREGSLRSLSEITRDRVEGVYEEVEGKRSLSEDRMTPTCDRSSIPSAMDKSVNIIDDDRHDRQPRIMNLFV